jgi:hypothetical protein
VSSSEVDSPPRGRNDANFTSLVHNLEGLTQKSACYILLQWGRRVYVSNRCLICVTVQTVFRFKVLVLQVKTANFESRLSFQPLGILTCHVLNLTLGHVAKTTQTSRPSFTTLRA